MLQTGACGGGDGGELLMVWLRGQCLRRVSWVSEFQQGVPRVVQALLVPLGLTHGRTGLPAHRRWGERATVGRMSYAYAPSAVADLLVRGVLKPLPGGCWVGRIWGRRCARDLERLVRIQNSP